MAKYRKRPIVIEARRLDTMDYDTACEIVAWCHGRMVNEGCAIDTEEGTMIAWPGDWIICGVKGEFYPCKPDTFAASYESAD